LEHHAGDEVSGRRVELSHTAQTVPEAD